MRRRQRRRPAGLPAGSTPSPRRGRCSCCCRWWRWWPGQLAEFIPLITSESSLAALGLSLRTSAASTAAVRGARRADGAGAGPRRASPASGCCAPWCCCRWCCRRWWAASRCSTPSAGRACWASAWSSWASRSRSPPPPWCSRRPSSRCRSWWSAWRARCAPPAAVRGGRRHPRRPPDHGAAPGHPAAGAARPDLRRGAVLRPRARRVRRHPDLRRQPAGRHPHPAAGDLPAARDRPRRRGRAVARAGRRGRGRRRARLPAPAHRRWHRRRRMSADLSAGRTLAARGLRGLPQPRAGRDRRRARAQRGRQVDAAVDHRRPAAPGRGQGRARTARSCSTSSGGQEHLDAPARPRHGAARPGAAAVPAPQRPGQRRVRAPQRRRAPARRPGQRPMHWLAEVDAGDLADAAPRAALRRPGPAGRRGPRARRRPRAAAAGRAHGRARRARAPLLRRLLSASSPAARPSSSPTTSWTPSCWPTG